jgi:hypothetical protein
MGVNDDAEDAGASHNHRSPSAKPPRAPPIFLYISSRYKNGSVGRCCGTNRKISEQSWSWLGLPT